MGNRKRKHYAPPKQIQIDVGPNVKLPRELIRHGHRYLFLKARMKQGGGLDATYERKINAPDG